MEAGARPRSRETGPARWADGLRRHEDCPSGESYTIVGGAYDLHDRICAVVEAVGSERAALFGPETC